MTLYKALMEVRRKTFLFDEEDESFIITPTEGESFSTNIRLTDEQVRGFDDTIQATAEGD